MKLALAPKTEEETCKSRAANQQSFYMNQWKLKSGIRVIAYISQEECNRSASSERHNNKSPLEVWPLHDLIKAERRIARGSLRPYIKLA